MATRRQATPKTKRVPVSGNSDILTVQGKDDGFVYRWVNDTDSGRIEMFKAAGYETVDATDIEVGQSDVHQASNIGKIKTKNVGQGVTSILMRIDKKFYEEDQRNKEVNITSKVESLNEHTKDLAGKHGSITIS